MIFDSDEYLLPFKDAILSRKERVNAAKSSICGDGLLSAFVNNHLYYGLHRDADGSWIFREWAPNATRIYFISESNNWKRTNSYMLRPLGGGDWELRLPPMFLHHGELYKLFIEWQGGGAERLPAYTVRAVQDPDTKVFCAQVWEPDEPYLWRNSRPAAPANPLIYECHIGMSGEAEGVATFDDFRRNVLPHIASLGYNTVQIMALQEHPYYGSFGYQVSNFFALSSRFGTPEEFKALVDEAHGLGLRVVMDLVHSHSVSNEAEGLSRFDGREDTYFHAGDRGHHPAWGSRCFDYGKGQVVHFLLSNCKFWLQEYMLDGFRFDGVTSMIYLDHGLERDFGSYEDYFRGDTDDDALTYLGLANILIHELVPDAITIAEDVSGMPGLAAPLSEGGFGFDFRLAMGIADHWIKWVKERPDESWSPGEIWWELTRKREDERTISYAECHDQALVGDKTLIFRLIDKEMYTSMDKASKSILVDRGIALHKMIRLITLATAGDGYLTFMGNEFGHPEWIDFPREGNDWSFKYARRQWSLCGNPLLRYKGLMDFDDRMIHFVAQNAVFEDIPQLLRSDEQKQVLIFKRKGSIFAFNFSPNSSYVDYEFDAPEGSYRLAFDSDDPAFDGQGRLTEGQRYFTLNREGRSVLSVYLPSRCAIVLAKE